MGGEGAVARLSKAMVTEQHSALELDKDLSNLDSTLNISDLATDYTSSGHIPKPTLGLSTTDTVTNSVNFPPNSSKCEKLNKKNLADRPPPTLLMLSHKDTPTFASDLAQNFPGVSKVLQDMSLFLIRDRSVGKAERAPLSQPRSQAADGAAKQHAVPLLSLPSNFYSQPPPQLITLTHKRQDPLIYQPTLDPLIHRPTLDPLIHRPTQDSLIHRPTPDPLIHRPTPDLLVHQTTPDPLVCKEYPLVLPDIPVRPFIPHLLNPKEVSPNGACRCPPLLEMNDPLSNMKKRGLQLLVLPPRDPAVPPVIAPPTGGGHCQPLTILSQDIRPQAAGTVRTKFYKRTKSSLQGNKVKAAPTVINQVHSPLVSTHSLTNEPTVMAVNESQPSHSLSSVLLTHTPLDTSPVTPPLDPPTSPSLPISDPPTSPSVPKCDPPTSPSVPICDPPTSPSVPICDPPTSPSVPICDPPTSPSIPICDPPKAMSHSVPLSSPVVSCQSIAIQVGGCSATVQVGESLNQCSTAVQTMDTSVTSATSATDHHGYLTVTDIEDEEDTSSELGPCDHENFEEGSKVESKGSLRYQYQESNVLAVGGDTIDGWGTRSATPPNEDDVMGRFRHLERQLSMIENKASDIKDEFTHSRKILSTIDRLSIGSSGRISIGGETTPCANNNNNTGGDISSVHSPHLTDSPENNNKTSEPVVTFKRDYLNSRKEALQSSEVKTTRLKPEGQHREELKAWMNRKRKERMVEYRKKREQLISQERQPYTPNHQVVNRGSCLTERVNSQQGRRRRLQLASDRSDRIRDAKDLMDEILTSNATLVRSTNANKSTLSDSLNSIVLLHTLPRHKSSSSSSVPTSELTAGNHSNQSSHSNRSNHGSHRGREDKRKRCLSSVEGLNEAEQLKMAEILRSVDGSSTVDRESVTSVESSIDWSQIDQLLLSA